MEKSELEPKQVFDFVGYQFNLRCGWVRRTPDWWQTLKQKLQYLISRPAVHVLNRSANSHREASSPWPTAQGPFNGISKTAGGYQNHWYQYQNHSYPRVPAPPSRMLTGGKQCASRSTMVNQG